MQETITIALDMMSGDHDISSSVPAAWSILKKHNDLSLILVGDENKIEKLLDPEMKKLEGTKYSILHTDEAIKMDDEILVALRTKKKIFDEARHRIS